MKKETKDRAKLAVGGIAIGTALAAPLGENIRKFAHNRIPISDNNLSEENKKLYSKLGRIAKNQKNIFNKWAQSGRLLYELYTKRANRTSKKRN